MKKMTALLLAALLLLGLMPAMAAEYDTLDQKLALQLQNGSGLTATATLSTTPNLKMSVLSETDNVMLAALLPGAALELRHIRGANAGGRGKEDLSLKLTRSGVQLADLKYLSDGFLESVSSTLLGAKPYASARGDGLLAALLLKQDATWPGVERPIWAMATADLEWRKQAEAQLKPITDKLSLWLQGYTNMTTERDAGGQAITVNTITVPAPELKKQLKAMMSELYANQAMMALLREQMTGAEARAYLEPTMLTGFHTAIDRLALDGSLAVQRKYDSTGRLTLDDIRLPMGGTRGIRQVHYRYELLSGGEGSTLVEVTMMPKGTAAGQQGSIYTLDMRGGPVADAQEGADTQSYTGTLTLQPEPGTQQAFTVNEAAKPIQHEWQFNLYMDHGAETVDAQTSRLKREHEITLLLKPQNMPGVGDQSIKLNMSIDSGRATSSATRFNGQLVWQDLSTEGAVTADISGASAPPWVIPSVDTADAIRLDRMTEQQLTLQQTQLQAALAAALTRMVTSLPVPTVRP